MTPVIPIYLCLLELRYRLSKYPAMASLSHRQGWSLAVLLLIFPAMLFAGAGRDTPSTTYRTGASEVRVTFFATDQNNRPVASVSPDDFAVVDSEMVIREFRSLNRSDETALDIVLLLDASESVEPRFREAVQDVLRLSSQSSHNPVDNVSVVSFAGLKPSLLCTGDCDSTAFSTKLVSLTAGGPTPFFDTLTYTAKFVARRNTPGVRQVVVVFSDGDDTISASSPRDALEAIASTGAILYGIDIHAPTRNSRNSHWLRKIAEATGGRTFCLQDGTDNFLEAVLRDLRASYVVTYSLPSRTVGFHSLRILPKHDLNLQFHCRRGYFYEEGQ